jgi:hypothetical protein
MASDAIAFLEAMEFSQADILGFSIGSPSPGRSPSPVPPRCAG